MKRIFSIIMELGLGLPTGTIAFWGTLLPRIWTVDHTFKLAHRLRRWPNLKLTLFQCFEFAGNTGNRPTADHSRATMARKPHRPSCG